MQMTLAQLIRDEIETILAEWQEYADQLASDSMTLTKKELRNDAERILAFVADDMESRQTAQEQVDKSLGKGAGSADTVDIARTHAEQRIEVRFSLPDVVAEYRALRASVIRLWRDRVAGEEESIDQLVRFNEAIDESLTSAVSWYSKRLREQEESLANAKKRQEEFLAMLGHELRNPLAPLRSSVDLLKLAGADQELLDSIHPMMDRQLTNLTYLTDELLDLSRIQQGTIDLKIAPTDARIAVEAGIDQIRHQIDDAGHALHLDIPDKPLMLDADGSRLTQVVANLLSNAARYTAPGGHIQLSAGIDDANLILRVQDNGSGIQADRQDDIFDVFTRLPKHRNQGGERALGVGLALVRRIVEMHGGKIYVHSDGPDQGSEFVVRLPIPESEASKQNTSSSTNTAGTFRLLVVDDNRDAADSVTMMLRARGHQALAVYDGDEALQQLNVHRPDTVLLDLGMPVMDGYEVARRIRMTSDGKDIRLIAVSGWGRAEDKVRAKEAGFDDYLTKPVEFDSLQSLL